jgi:hypothetical protein
MRKLLLTITAAAAILSAPLASAQATIPVTAAGIEAALADSTVVQNVAYVCRHRPLTSRRMCWWQVGFYRHWHRHWRWRHWHWPHWR